MWQANWMSLGIMVTLLACMARRLTSSMRPTTYASAASCRYMMALPWKCRSYLPTSRAISQTNHKKGCFLMRSSVLFWNCWISQRATVAGLVFPGLLYFTSLEEFLLGGFASNSRSELPPDWLLLTQHRWPSLCSYMGQLSGWWWQQWWWPACILQPPASSTHFSASSTCFFSSLMDEGFLAGDGWWTGEGASIPSLLGPSQPPWIGEPTPPHPLLLPGH